ncbi:MAG: response regulator [Planctomycetia bacterium]|nr:response regulator [Planctomycetia bacterium]
MTRVLIVDDNENNLYLLRALLLGHGWTVDEARHGADALTLARQTPPELIVSDLLMPVMDGYTLLRQWKADPQLKSIPFMVYTATYTDPRDERLALDLGADAFLIKPAEPEAFMACVQDVMSRSAPAGQPTRAPQMEEAAILKEYSETLVRKLEKRAQQLEQANRDLQAEIAECRRMEGELRASEERYRGLFHAIADPLFVYDRESLRYLAVNDAAVAKYGYSRDEFLGMTLKDIRPSEDVPALLEMLAKSGTQREDRGVWRHRTKYGEILEMEITAFALEFAGRPACIVQARDVTERRRIEEALRMRDRAIQAVSQGILIADPNQPGQPVVYASAGFERITGYRTAEVLGKNCRFLQGPETDRDVVRRIREAIAAGRGCSVELLNYRKDGTPFWNGLSINPVHDERGKLAYFVGVVNDVTERRRLEDQLRQAQKMEAVGRLAGGVAHDFNNLLTIISGYSEVLLGLPNLGDRMRESVKAISEAGARAAALTRQLLGFSRQTMLQPQVLDVNAVVAETSKLLRRLIGEDILFATVLDPRLSRVKVDPTQLDQVLMNLAVNARDAMPKGGKLTIETSNVLLSDDYVRTHPDCKAGQHVMLAMTDTGCGMAPEVLARVFEPFFTTKEVGKGTGLGLAMVFGIVQQSGGCIHVYSEPGRGTTFKVYFPAVDEPIKKSGDSKQGLAARGAETILMVEDEEAVRGMALLSLQMHGYTVLTAENGKAALKVAEAHRGPLDLILSDVVMPGLSGPELVQALRPRFPHVKVLFMSGYTDDAVVRHGLLQAEVSFIQKPFTPLSLARKIRQVLDEPAPGRA